MKQKGITLVALVVTIIILLILAGVTIAQISGEDGLFSRVRQAVEKYKDASIEEQGQILEIEKFVSEFSTTEQEGVTVKITKLEVTAGTDSIEVLVEVEGEPSKIEYSIDNGKTYKTEEGDITSRTYKYENLKPGGYFIKVRVYDAEEKYQEATSDIVTVTPITTAEAEDVLKDKTFLTGDGIIKTGSMKKHEMIEETIQPGGKYTIEEGYYEGGTITAEGLGNNTPGTAEAGDILKNKTAWVDGEQVTGTIETQSKINTTLDAGTSVKIPAGYYSEEGTVAAKSLADQTPGTATAAQILSGKTAWVGGNLITGTMPDNSGGTLPWIYLRGSSGTSETKEFVPGKYEVCYFTTCYSIWDKCPMFQVFSNSVKIMDTRGSKWTGGSLGGVDFSGGGGTMEFNLTEKSKVYCTIYGGSFTPYGMICIFKIG